MVYLCLTTAGKKKKEEIHVWKELRIIVSLIKTEGKLCIVHRKTKDKQKNTKAIEHKKVGPSCLFLCFPLEKWLDLTTH